MVFAIERQLREPGCSEGQYKEEPWPLIITICKVCTTIVLWALHVSFHSDILVVQVTQDKEPKIHGSRGAHGDGNQSSMTKQSTLYHAITFPCHDALPLYSSPEKLAGEDQPYF